MPVQEFPARLEDILTNTEVKILEIADQLAAAKKTISVEALFRRAKRTLIETNEEISNAIYQLILKRFIIIGSKMTKTQVLSNKNRNRIYQYILKNPGCHLNEIKEYMNIKGQLGKWHLSILENFNFIFSVRYLKYLYYFPVNFNRDIARPFVSIKNPNAHKIFTALWDNPIMSLPNLKLVIQADLTTIKYHLRKLIASKVVSVLEQNKKVLYYLNQNTLIPLSLLIHKNTEELQKFLITQDRILEVNFISKGK